jgi:hypothetical protein
VRENPAALFIGYRAGTLELSKNSRDRRKIDDDTQRSELGTHLVCAQPGGMRCKRVQTLLLKVFTARSSGQNPFPKQLVSRC